jgi:ribosomal protein S18 acetylase RimI-like enzyme
VQQSSRAPDPPWLVTSPECNPGAVERLLRMLPEWFGIESSVVEYVESARKLPTYLAWPAAGSANREELYPVGALLAARHFPCSAEIHLMAVDPAVHRRGAGRAMVAALEADLVADGAEFLEVKTLGPSHPDSGYELTRRFYVSVGFRPLEEIHGLWPDNPCLVMIKSLR